MMPITYLQVFCSGITCTVKSDPEELGAHAFEMCNWIGRGSGRYAVYNILIMFSYYIASIVMMVVRIQITVMTKIAIRLSVKYSYVL